MVNILSYLYSIVYHQKLTMLIFLSSVNTFHDCLLSKNKLNILFESFLHLNIFFIPQT